MATETVRDYLGHPCAIAEAAEYFEESLKKARMLELRALNRQIGALLNEVNERMVHTLDAMQVVRDALPGSTDDDGARAVLAMAIQYDVESCNRFYDLAGYVLAALEKGKQVEAANA